MPLYMYRCRNCNHEFEIRQKMAEDPLLACPNCEQDQLRRVINQVGIVFKGSGFYVTDNKGNNPAGVTKTATDSSSDSSSGSSNDSSGKTEAKSESKDTKKSTAKADTKNTKSKKSESS